MSFQIRKPSIDSFLALLFLSVPMTVSVRAAAPVAAPDYAHAVLQNHLWHWQRFPVRVFIAARDTAEVQESKAVLAGFNEWVGATARVIRYVGVNNPNQADITVRFTSAASLPGQQNVVGKTDMQASRGGVLRKASIVLATENVTAEEMQSVAAHEFGHALGIGGHSADSDDLMYPVETRILSPEGIPLAFPARAVTRRDVNTLRWCYPALPIPPL